MDLKRKLDIVFSQYIRKRDTPGRCISCGKFIRYDNCDAGHYIPRQHLATRFDERNVNAQCKECNQYKYGNLNAYSIGLDRKYGKGTADELQTLKNTTIKLSRSDYTEMIKKYR